MNDDFVHVAFDCDGVLRDFINGSVRAYVEDHPEKKGFFNWPPKPTGGEYGLASLIKNSYAAYEDEIDLFTKYVMNEPTSSYKVFRHAPVRQEAKDSFTRYYKILKKIGCKVSIFTKQRNFWQQKATLDWLIANRIPYDDLILCGTTKRGYAFDYFLDDDPRNVITATKDNAKAYLLDVYGFNGDRRIASVVKSIEEFVDIIIKENL